MEAIPDEILIVIFSYCKVEDLALSVRFVCTRWERVTGDELLWQNLVLHMTPWLVNKTTELFCVCRHLHALVLYADIDHIAGKLSSYLPLHTLRLWSSRTPLPAVVHQLVSTFPHLVDFGIMFRDCNVWDYVEAFKCLISVKLISVSYSGRDRGLIRAILHHCPTLVGLNISGCFWLNDDDLLAIIEEKSSTLQRLSFDGVLFTGKSLSQLSQCVQLQSLDIGSSDLSPDRLSTIKELSALRCLDLHHAKNIPSHFYHIFFASSKLNNLTELKIFQCRFTDHAALLLSRNCARLRILKLKIISKDSTGSDENLDECRDGLEYDTRAHDTCRAYTQHTARVATSMSAEGFSDEGFKVLVTSLRYLQVFEVVCERLTDKYFNTIFNNLRLILFCRIRGKHNHFSWPPKRSLNAL